MIKTGNRERGRHWRLVRQCTREHGQLAARAHGILAFRTLPNLAVKFHQLHGRDEMGLPDAIAVFEQARNT